MVARWTRVPVVLAALLLAAACGPTCGSSTSSSSGSTPATSIKATPVVERPQHVATVDPCTLVTADEASAAAGSTLTNLAATGGVQIPGACIYGASDSSTAVLVFAQAYPDASAASAVQPDQMAAAFGAQFGVSNAKTVTGIGDKAFEYTATGAAGGGIAIFVFKYNVIMWIIVDPASDPSVIERLARTAVGRLVVS
jgi:hypothetical protein